MGPDRAVARERMWAFDDRLRLTSYRQQRRSADAPSRLVLLPLPWTRTPIVPAPTYPDIVTQGHRRDTRHHCRI